MWLVPVRFYIGKLWTCSTPRSKFLHFHAVFGKPLQNNRLVIPPFMGWRPLGNPGFAAGYALQDLHLYTTISGSISCRSLCIEFSLVVCGYVQEFRPLYEILDLPYVLVLNSKFLLNLTLKLVSTREMQDIPKGIRQSLLLG